MTTRTNDMRWIVRARCKQWSCLYCAGRNRKIWQARIINFINESDMKWGWFTLTAHSKKRTPEESLKNLRSAWEKLVKRIKRKYKHIGKIHYVRVFERHQDGAYHLHCIISIHWDDLTVRKSRNGKEVSYSRWLARTARELKIGYYTHAANFNGAHAGYIAGYVTKYMTKFDPLPGIRVRNVQCSNGWPDKYEKSDYQWECHDAYWFQDFTKDLEDGVTVIDLNEKREVNTDDFIYEPFYPVFPSKT